MKILITGVAGFIGCHLAKKLLQDGHEVVGLDNLNDYYDVSLKESRLKELLGFKKFIFKKADICDFNALDKITTKYRFKTVVHLAAQAGVRYSVTNPEQYLKSNINGFFNILEISKKHSFKHLIYASSSSIYGMNVKQPFSTNDLTDFPISFYAATKKSNELMAHAYSHLNDIPITGLRFFTVYGPFGRPDMAYYKFTKNILADKPIEVYNKGEMYRDFTYIDDIIESIKRILDKPPSTQKNVLSNSVSKHRVFNIGNSSPVKLINFIKTIEKYCDKKAKIKFRNIQPGDVLKTYADTKDFVKEIGYKPKTSIDEGISEFVNWFKEYHK